MNSRISKILEFHKIKEHLLKHASSSLGKELVQGLKPSSQLEEVQQWQDETDEAYQVLRIKGNIPLGGIFDIRPFVKRAVIGGVLNPTELLDIASTIGSSRQLKKFVESIDEEQLAIPILRELTNNIVVLNELERSIKQCIDDHGYVMDGASDTLRNIRSKIRTHENSVREKLEQYTRKIGRAHV